MSNTDNIKEVQYGDCPSDVISWIKLQLEKTTDKVFVCRGWCKRCGICIAFCPVKALDRDSEGYPVVSNDKCISCGTCERMCPDFAIIVTNLKEKRKKKKPGK